MAAEVAAGGRAEPFDSGSKEDLELLYNSVVKLCDKAGINEKCTPSVLRAKLANDMGLGTGGLDGCEVILSKMIIRWWKAKGEEQLKQKKLKDAKQQQQNDKGKEAVAAVKPKTEKAPAAAPAAAASAPAAAAAAAASGQDKIVREVYNKLRLVVKEMGKASILDGISDLPDLDTKLSTLRKRVMNATNATLSEMPTDEEIEAIRSMAGKSKREGGEDEEAAATKKQKVET